MLSFVREVLWSLPTVALLTAVGVYFTVRSRFYQIRGIKHILTSVRYGGGEGISPFSALMTALGGTVGVGSITGVAYALTAGGAGAVFWMWVTGFFGMMLKYAEVYMAVLFRKQTPCGYDGSAARVLSAAGKPFAAGMFAVLCVLASLGSGNLVQAGAVAEAAAEIGIPPLLCAALTAALLAPTVFGGQKRIAAVNSAVLPVFSALLMLFLSAAVILNLRGVPEAFSAIFREAFGIRQAGAGISGALISIALRTGATRGVFSNEAGMGSSPIAHAASPSADPQKSGDFGVIEVFIDTFLVSTFCAVALLSGGFDTVTEMFSELFGVIGSVFLTVSLLVFAFASIISWCFYSEGCIRFLFGDRRLPRTLYRTLSVAAAFAGCIIPLASVWDAADIFNALMIVPNLYALILKRKDISF